SRGVRAADSHAAAGRGDRSVHRVVRRAARDGAQLLEAVLQLPPHAGRSAEEPDARLRALRRQRVARVRGHRSSEEICGGAGMNGYTPQSYKTDLKPVWCPGCGDFGVLNSLYRALAELKFEPHDTVVVSGIGCSSRLPGYVEAYGFNSFYFFNETVTT